MNNLKSFIQEKIDELAKNYENSTTADEFIEFKIKADEFLIKRTQAIREFYKSFVTEDRISFKYKYKSIEMRTTFYKSGSMHVVIEHYSCLKKFTKDNNIMSQFALDVGHVYFIESEFGWKIGKTKNLYQRRKIFDVKLPFVFALRYHVRTHEKTKLEKYFHDYFKDRQINGEWFLIKEDDIIECINKLPQLRLSRYSPDQKIFIDRKYLNEMILSEKTIETVNI